MNTTQDARFPIGTQFSTRGKAPRICTVTDILKTYNSAGVLVAIRYVATHEYCGQFVTESNILDTTIAMGLFGETQKEFARKQGKGV